MEPNSFEKYFLLLESVRYFRTIIHISLMTLKVEGQDDRYWMEEFRKGNEKALAHFYQLHGKALTFFSSRLLQDEDEAMDVVSDCIVKLWNKHNDFSDPQGIKAFLYISCRNACLNHLAHLKVKSAAQETFLRELEQGEETILLDIIKSEMLEILDREIEALPDTFKEVFKRIYMEGKKTDEIAVELGLSVKTVRNYKANAVEYLKTAMLKRGISGAAYLAFLMMINAKP